MQGIYARAFYAASDTKTPMITGTLITVLSIPMYWGLFHALGLMGLAIASDIGILVQTASLAILLHRKRLVSLAHLEFGELGPRPPRRARRLRRHRRRRAPPAARLHPRRRTSSPSPLASVAWLAAAALTLLATGSKLPAQILRRR